MSWLDRYSWFILGATAMFTVLDVLGFVHPGLKPALDELVPLNWLCAIVVFFIACSLFKQLILDRRRSKVYKDERKP